MWTGGACITSTAGLLFGLGPCAAIAGNNIRLPDFLTHHALFLVVLILHNHSMSRLLTFRLFLAFALMLGSMMSAQASLRHVLMSQPPVVVAKIEISHCDEAGMDMSRINPGSDAGSLHKVVSCCQGLDCGCSGVMPLALPVFTMVPAFQGQQAQGLRPVTRYTSVAALRMLRPPIA